MLRLLMVRDARGDVRAVGHDGQFADALRDAQHRYNDDEEGKQGGGSGRQRVLVQEWELVAQRQLLLQLMHAV